MNPDELADDCDPRAVLLAAMLADQIQTLGRLHGQGAWHSDPREMMDFVGRTPGTDSRIRLNRREAVTEMQLWGPATDALIDAVEAMTVIRIDRGRILSEARRVGAGDARSRRMEVA